ncbi:MAG TPA: alpha/beta fold hydrolase, partial [Polyangiales bacterium]|nr:alpha/beta fold hydrolase [Polyangiales bacterium]
MAGSERAQLMAALRSGAANVACQLGSSERPSCAIIRRLERSALRQLGVTTRTGAFLLTALELRIEPHILRAFGAAYGLTPTEAEVAMALARGSSPSAIAEERGVSLNTVRTQIKVVLRKLEVQAISDVIRLLSAFAAGCPSSQPQADEAPAHGVRQCGRLTLPDGRTMAYEQSGAPHGRPVLFLHNMLHGVSLSTPAIAAARSCGWRLIAPSRPGFGRSDALPGARGLELVDAVAHDCQCLLDHLQIPRALVLGHLSGGIYATRFAERMPLRTTGLLLASYLPTWEDSRMLTMSSLARWMALAARHTPRLLPFIAQAGCAHVLAGCESQLLSKLHGEIPTDMEALSIPEVRCVVDEGLRHASIQGGTAFCNDCPLVLSDWIELARRVSRPARLFIGSDDMFARPDAVRAF